MQRRDIQKQAKKNNQNRSAILTEVNKSEWPPHEENLKTVLISKYYLVQVFDEGNCKRLSVNRTTIDSKGNWESDISWEELQEIKRQAGYGDQFAVEIYPKDRDIVNIANMRHLWVLDNDLDFGWRD